MQPISEFLIGVICFFNKSDLDQRGRVGVVDKDKAKSIEALLRKLAIPADTLKCRKHACRKTSFSRLSASLPDAIFGSPEEVVSVFRRMDIIIA
jgi:hypothetical protein